MSKPFPVARTVRLTWRMDDCLAQLARKRGTSIAATIRQLIYEAAQSEGIESSLSEDDQ